MDKNLPGQNLPDKRPPDKPPGQKPQRTIEREFVQGAFVRVFCTRPTQRCVTHFLGGPGMCDRGSKLAKNSVTYFMDGPCDSEARIVGHHVKTQLDIKVVNSQ